MGGMTHAMNDLETENIEEVRTWDVLLKIGFRKSTNPYSNGGKSLKYEAQVLDLEAISCTGKYFRDVILISGIYRSARSCGEIGVELALIFKSERQAMAMLAYYLGDYFSPRGDAPLPEWLKQGLADADLLPWCEEAAAYAARPHCIIDRDFARIMRTRLREFLDHCPKDAQITFSFDGDLLKVIFLEKPLIIPAEGNAWPETYTLLADRMQKLPSRFNSMQVIIGIWEKKLCLANWHYSLGIPTEEQLRIPEIDANKEG